MAVSGDNVVMASPLLPVIAIKEIISCSVHTSRPWGEPSRRRGWCQCQWPGDTQRGHSSAWSPLPSQPSSQLRYCPQVGPMLYLYTALSLSLSGPISGVTSDGRAGRLLSNPLGLIITYSPHVSLINHYNAQVCLVTLAAWLLPGPALTPSPQVSEQS